MNCTVTVRPSCYYLHQGERSEHLWRLKGMSDERQNRPILSANKIAPQKSVVCHAKITRFCRPTKLPDFCRPR